MSEALVDRLRGIYRIPITDGLGAVGSGEEPDNPNEFVRKFETAPIQHEAADRIEALERENAALRDDDAKMQLLHQQEDQLIAAERKVAELEADQKEARGWARSWHQVCQTIATILDLPEPEGETFAQAVSDKWRDFVPADHYASANHARNAAEADKARLSEALREALAANERDRTEIVIAVNALTDAFARRDWLIRGGRGSYEWDDDRFRDEFRDAMEEFQPHIDQLRKIGADRTNCPKTQAEVIAARAALSGSGSGWRAPDGWKLVPVEPTEEMYRAAYKEQDDAATHNYGASPTFDDYWSAALEACPAAPQQGGE